MRSISTFSEANPCSASSEIQRAFDDPTDAPKFHVDPGQPVGRGWRKRAHGLTLLRIALTQIEIQSFAVSESDRKRSQTSNREPSFALGFVRFFRRFVGA
jgi:hypothetical protein